MIDVAPTKTNLVKAKDILKFSKDGYELLDKKRNVLIKEMMGFVREAEALQRDIDAIFEEAYKAIDVANIMMGSNSVDEISTSIPKQERFRLRSRSIMGVEIPELIADEPEVKVAYGLFRTNITIDIAVLKMNELRERVYRLAEIENTVYRLAMEIKKTAKRANSLEKIQIPKYTEITKYIEDVLEEKEREDFFRLKKLKRKGG